MERDRLRRLGFAVSSSWMEEVYTSDTDVRITEEVRRGNAERDRDEVEACGAFIIDTFDESTTGGREAELGMAIILGKPTYHVGPYRNVFHTLIDFSFDSWEDLYAHLEELS